VTQLNTGYVVREPIVGFRSLCGVHTESGCLVDPIEHRIVSLGRDRKVRQAKVARALKRRKDARIKSKRTPKCGRRAEGVIQ